ncbi:MAG: ferredoxin [Alphaproteobacteria bacterium]|nr:ferredoxin [Alphaproteobacteria bacterium]MCB9696235.1 ferredoxin [Alphaproteobacteria bacterium]
MPDEARIEVVEDRCQGHSRCVAIAPDLFDCDELGNVVLLGDGRVSPEALERARLAVLNCPERALVLREGGGA